MSAPNSNPASRLAQGLGAVAALYDADAPTSRPMVRHRVRRGGPLLPDADATADLLREVVAAGQAAGQIRTDLDPTLAAQLLLDVYLGRLYRWAAEGGTFRQQLQPAIAMVLDALRPTGPPSR